MSFLLWLADLEASAIGEEKTFLGQLCEKLVLVREAEEESKMDELYQSTLLMLADNVSCQADENSAPDRFLSYTNETSLESTSISPNPSDNGGDLAARSEVMQKRRERALALLSSNPELYAVELSERLTGAPLLVQGYANPVFDAVLQVAPPAVLSPEGIRQAHAEAAELAVDLKGRKKRSVQSIIGRCER